MAKICIVGAGSIGCYVGGRLLAAGADVALVGRARIGNELSAHGLTLTDYRNGRWQVPPAAIRYTADPRAAADADLVLVTVKSAAAESVADELKPVLRAGAIVVSFQNGLRNADILRAALPQQTVAQAREDLQQLMDLQPDHISYYQLTLEPNTEFAARPPALPDDDIAWDMQEQGQQMLASGGYRQYEVSAYAQAGRQARHNLNYWMFGDYLGIGAGAHGKRTLGGEVRRRARHKHPRRYQEQAGNAAAVQEDRRVGPAELPFEFMLNALRLNEGFRIRDYEARTGLAWDDDAPALRKARQLGLIEESAAAVRASALGQRHLNTLLTLFLD